MVRSRLYLFADPPHQIGVVAGQQRKQRGAVERPLVVQPAPHHRIDLACEVGEVVTRSCGAAPSADLPADLVVGGVADRWLERGEELASFAPSGSGAKSEPQERECGNPVVEPPSVVLAVDDIRLVGMQPQPDVLPPVPDCGHQPFEAP